MAESREYVSRSDELGNIHISEEVLAVIAAAAALEVEGVGGLAANLGSDLAELLGKKNLSRGIRLHVEEESVTIDVAILVKYGYTIPDVARAVQEGIAGSVEATSGLSVAAVNVSVGGVVFDKEPKKAP
ncbi:MAG TPA: Asp23/Gls24 family envelope stress response protein [Candidatus Intestinimonas stercoravium]|uniref:Asp23/Gls24 family envelope stress response protein n=1 Tax=uncultured Intestinimonas sp. TaxID=1689265 RepID=UPI001FA637AC|nr:Asp23/Gls24 family envelope stress response protein [uncultured Intestinimonas sp.]HJA63362.1 Asp23/Gls24 family envelope stress response protein [Candidatus Intestinimonas stercoravium]